MRSAKIGISTTYGIAVTLTAPSSRRSARIARVRATKRNPSAISASAEARAWRIARGGTRIASSPARTPRKLTPFAKKHHPSPIAPTSTPATAGPMIRAPLKIDEFSAMAFGRSSRPTISTTNDWRAGMSNAFTTPSAAPNANRCGTRMRPVSVSAARANASAIAVVWVARRIRWRLRRSATAPPIGARRNTGICVAKLSRPRSTEEPVRR
jgi:hypothetical protein